MSESSSEIGAAAGRKRQKFSKDQRNRILRELEESKLTAAEFCRRRGFDPATLYRWRSKTREGGRSRRRATRASKEQVPGFIEVDLKRPLSEGAPMAVWASGGIELQINQAHQVGWAVQLLQDLKPVSC